MFCEEQNFAPLSTKCGWVDDNWTFIFLWTYLLNLTLAANFREESNAILGWLTPRGRERGNGFMYQSYLDTNTDRASKLHSPPQKPDLLDNSQIPLVFITKRHDSLFLYYLKIHLIISILTDLFSPFNQASGVALNATARHRRNFRLFSILAANERFPAASSSEDLYRPPSDSDRSLSEVEMSFDQTESIWEPRSLG